MVSANRHIVNMVTPLPWLKTRPLTVDVGLLKMIEIRVHEVHELLLLPWQVQKQFPPSWEENCALGHVTRPLKPRTPLLPICR